MNGLWKVFFISFLDIPGFLRNSTFYFLSAFFHDIIQNFDYSRRLKQI